MHTARIHLPYGLVRPLRGDTTSQRDVLRSAVWLAALCWAPLGAIAIMERGTSGRTEPLLRDLSVHVRLLIALPLLLLAQGLIERRCHATLARLAEERYVDPAIIARLADRQRRRLHATTGPGGLVTLAIVLAQLSFWGVLSSGVVAGERLVGSRGPACIWYAWVALPVYYVASLRVLLQWVLWSSASWSVARADPRTDAAHPDRAGGIGFLAQPSLVFAVALMASGAVLASAWGTEILHGTATVKHFVQPIAAWALVAMAVAVAPLLCFIPHMVRTKREGKYELGRVAIECARTFRQRWIESRSDTSLLDSPDVSSFADLDHTFRSVRRMRVIPIGPGDLLQVMAGALLPMLPFALAEVPISNPTVSFVRMLV